jgi:hypothetical protein
MFKRDEKTKRAEQKNEIAKSCKLGNGIAVIKQSAELANSEGIKGATRKRVEDMEPPAKRNTHSQTTKHRRQNMIHGMWATLAAVRCVESWKDGRKDHASMAEYEACTRIFVMEWSREGALAHQESAEEDGAAYAKRGNVQRLGPTARAMETGEEDATFHRGGREQVATCAACTGVSGAQGVSQGGQGNEKHVTPQCH